MQKDTIRVARSNSQVIRAIGLIGLVVISLSLALIVVSRIGDTNIWFDEASQILISRGEWQFDKLGSGDNSIGGVMHMNSINNLDPGGFSVLVWGTQLLHRFNIHALRALSILFGILTLGALYGCLLKFKFQPIVSAFLAFMLLGSPLFSHYFSEIRPYSLECFCWIVILYAAIESSEIRGNCLPRSIVFAAPVLLWFRYSVCIPIAGLVILEICRVLRSSSFAKSSRRKHRLVVMLWACSLSSLAIFFTSLRHHVYGVNAPPYIKSLTIANGDLLDLLFGGLRPLVWLGPVILVLFSLACNNIGRDRRSAINSYLGIFTIAFSLQAIISAFGLYTFSFTSRWDIGLHSLGLVSWIILLGIFVEGFCKSDRLRRGLCYVVMTVATVVALKHHQVRSLVDYSYKEMEGCGILDQVRNPKILANRNAMPVLRVLLGDKEIDGKSYYKNINFFRSEEEGDVDWSGRYVEGLSAWEGKIDPEVTYVVLSHFNRELPEHGRILEDLALNGFQSCSARGHASANAYKRIAEKDR